LQPQASARRQATARTESTQSKGGYRAVAEAATNSQAVKNAGGRMLAALRRALAKTAEGAV
jgi:hypothetical protein